MERGPEPLHPCVWDVCGHDRYGLPLSPPALLGAGQPFFQKKIVVFRGSPIGFLWKTPCFSLKYPIFPCFPYRNPIGDPPKTTIFSEKMAAPPQAGGGDEGRPYLSCPHTPHTHGCRGSGPLSTCGSQRIFEIPPPPLHEWLPYMEYAIDLGGLVSGLQGGCSYPITHPQNPEDPECVRGSQSRANNRG